MVKFHVYRRTALKQGSLGFARQVLALMPVLQAFNLGLWRSGVGGNVSRCAAPELISYFPISSHRLPWVLRCGRTVNPFASLDWRKWRCAWVCLHLVEESVLEWLLKTLCILTDKYIVAGKYFWHSMGSRWRPTQLRADVLCELGFLFPCQTSAFRKALAPLKLYSVIGVSDCLIKLTISTNTYFPQPSQPRPSIEHLCLILLCFWSYIRGLLNRSVIKSTYGL